MEDLWELKLTFRWNTPGTLPSLAILDVADNNLTGALPTAWGTSQSVLLTQGEVHAARTGLWMQSSWFHCVGHRANAEGCSRGKESGGYHAIILCMQATVSAGRCRHTRCSPAVTCPEAARQLPAFLSAPAHRRWRPGQPATTRQVSAAPRVAVCITHIPRNFPDLSLEEE